jgi:hypothetical protein
MRRLRHRGTGLSCRVVRLAAACDRPQPLTHLVAEWRSQALAAESGVRSARIDKEWQRDQRYTLAVLQSQRPSYSISNFDPLILCHNFNGSTSAH